MKVNNITSTPWYIKLFKGISGWISAFFFIFFVGSFLSITINIDINKYPIILLIIGLVLLFISYKEFQEEHNEFMEQFILAISITAQALIIASVFIHFKNYDGILLFIFIALFQAILVWVIPNYIHKMLSTSFMIFSISYIFGSYLFLLLLVLLIIYLLMNKSKTEHINQIEAIQYGLIFSLMVLLSFLPFIDNNSFIYHKNALFLGTSNLIIYFMSFFNLAYITYLVLQSLNKLNDKKVLILLIASVLLVSIITSQIQGLIICMILLLIGFAQSFKLLTGLGIFGTIAFISNYYYYIGETLLDKSILLAILGLVLLAIYFVFKFVFKKEIKNV